MKPFVSRCFHEFFLVLAHADVLPSSVPVDVMFGESFVTSCSYIISIKCTSNMYDKFRFTLVIRYVSDSDNLEHTTIPFYNDEISEYKFRKLRKLLKENGYL